MLGWSIPKDLERAFILRSSSQGQSQSQNKQNVGIFVEPTISLKEWHKVIARYLEKDKITQAAENEKECCSGEEKSPGVSVCGYDAVAYLLGTILPPRRVTYEQQALQREQEQMEATALGQAISQSLHDAQLRLDKKSLKATTYSPLATTAATTMLPSESKAQGKLTHALHAVRMKHVQSRIGSQIRNDRDRWLHVREQRNDAATTAIAKHRLELFTSQPSATEVSNNKSVTKRRFRDLSASLSSGAASREIAEAFLAGPIGRELSSGGAHFADYCDKNEGVHYAEQPAKAFFVGAEVEERRVVVDDVDDDEQEFEEDENEDLTEEEVEARKEAGFLLGGGLGRELARKQNKFIRHGASSSYTTTNSAAGLGLGHRTVERREADKKVGCEAKPLYAEGWRSSKGGWVSEVIFEIRLNYFYIHFFLLFPSFSS